MTHEHTHVERHDFIFAVLAELNRCLYWFHPLSWWLRTRLSDLAEEACDDAAIGLTGDPTGYARHLLEVATALSRGEGRVCQPGMSMARQSNVEGRIATILDLTRPLSERLTWKTTMAILAIMVPTIALAAALQPTLQNVAPAEDPANVADSQGTEPTPVNFENETAKLKNGSILSATVELSGRVVDPEGKPIADAELLLTRWDIATKSSDEQPLAVTKADGTFRVNVDRAVCKPFASVLVLADGFGFASRSAIAFEEAGTMIGELPEAQQKYFESMLQDEPDLKLKLDDVPLRGRILNPEGQIVPGARVKVTEVWESKDGKLDEWEEAAKAPRADYYSVRDKAPINLSGPRTGRIARVDVADDGTFTVHGIGRDRIVRISLMAPGVAGAQVYARTRPGETINLPNQWQNGERLETYYASNFRHVAGATQALEGQVTDRDTGEPVAGARIVANNLAGSNLSSMTAAEFINATTDQDGRYRLEGLPVGRNGFLVLPTLESGYVRVASSAKIAASTESLVQDINVPRGVKLTGGVIDSNTGKGLLGHYSYYASLTHPTLSGKDRIRLAHVDMQHDRTDKDGRFAMNVLPGRGLLGFMADNAGDYSRGNGADEIANDESPVMGAKSFRTAPHFLMAANYNVVAEFNGTVNEPPKLDLQLRSGMSFDVKVIDGTGKELKDYLFYGARKTSNWYSAKLDHGKVIGHKKTDTRRLFAWNPPTNEAGTLLIEGAPPENPVIRLQPAGEIIGRLVDKNGEPLEGVAIRSSAYVNGYFDQPAESTDLGSFPDDADTRREHLVTDNDGRFKIRGVLPTLKYTAAASRAAESSSPNGMAMHLGDLFRDVVITGAETKNLGDVQVLEPQYSQASPGAAPIPSQKAMASGDVKKPNEVAASKVQKSTSKKSVLTITGRVTVPGGNPKVIEVNVRRVFQRTAYAAPRTSKWIASVLTVPDLDFKLTIPADSLPNELSVEGEWITVQASAEGYGLAAVTIREVAHSTDIELILPKEQPIQGRILDLEGQPIAGATLRVTEATSNDTNSMDAWLEAVAKQPRQPKPGMMFNMVSVFDTSTNKASAPRLKSQDLEIPIETLGTTKTDSSGRFMINGLGKDQMVRVEVEGPGIAKAVIPVICRPMKSIHGGSQSHLHIGGENHYGSTFDYVAAPSAPVTGVVRDKVSLQPISGVTVAVTSVAGSPMTRDGWLTAITDSKGRYTINGLPTAVDSSRYPNRITISGPKQPYIMTDFRLPSSATPETIEFNPELRRAVLATGRLTDLKTGHPIKGSIFYTPFSANAANADFKRYSDGIRHYLGNDRHYSTDDDGHFQIPVIPGRGVIGVICEQKIYCRAYGMEDIAEFDSFRKKEVSRLIGGITNDFLAPQTMHMVKAIDVPTDAESFNVDLQADPGQSVCLHILPLLADSVSNKLTSKLWVEGATSLSPGSVSTSSGTAEVTGLADGESRLIYIHDEARTIGIVRTVDAKNRNLKVLVPPLATVKGQLVDVKKNPLKGRSVTAAVRDSNFFRIVAPAQTNDSGFFELKVPVGGPYDIITEVKPGPQSSRPITVKTELTVIPDPHANSLKITVDIGAVSLSGDQERAEKEVGQTLTPSGISQ